jgi:hypothetical protein
MEKCNVFKLTRREFFSCIQEGKYIKFKLGITWPKAIKNVRTSWNIPMSKL